MKNITNLSVKRFLNCFRGCGKTYRFLNELENELKQGNRVCVVTSLTPSVFGYMYIRHDERFAKYKDQVEVITVQDLLESFVKFDVDGVTDHEWLIQDPECVSFHHLKRFQNFDKVMVGAEAYEYIILHLCQNISDAYNGWMVS